MKDKSDVLLLREAVRQAFLATDPAGMGIGGTWYPESEYDTEVDRAVGWLAKGLSPGEVAARTMRSLARDWGVDVQSRKQEQLSHALDLISSQPWPTDGPTRLSATRMSPTTTESSRRWA